MKLLFALIVLLAASGANAVEPAAAALRKGVVPSVADAGTPRTRGGPDDEVLVFDSVTGAPEVYSLLASPRTFMGMAFDMETDVGPDPLISRIVVYMIYNGSVTQDFAALRARAQLWDVWSGNDQPVFSAPATLVERTLTDFNVEPGAYYALSLTPTDPIPLSGLTSHGIAINFQGDMGAGFQNVDTLTSLVRGGDAPIAVGSNPLIGNTGYRNKDGGTDFNFLPAHGFAIDAFNQALALKLYAIDTFIDQAIVDFVANPANPLFTDASFTVSATGGASNFPVTFSVDASSAAVCTAGGTHGATLTILGQGTCLVHADQVGNATYRAAPRQSLAVQIGIGALVQDGGFELGLETPWLQGSSNFDTPLCNVWCSPGAIAPHSGENFIWFSGPPDASEAAFVQQTGTIPVGAQWLDFHLWWASAVVAPPDPDAVFNVLIDGTTVFSLTPATAAAYAAGYTQASVDIQAFADGNAHTVRFEASSAATNQSTSVLVDDIRIGAFTEALFLDGFEPQ